MTETKLNIQNYVKKISAMWADTYAETKVCSSKSGHPLTLIKGLQCQLKTNVVLVELSMSGFF